MFPFVLTSPQPFVFEILRPYLVGLDIYVFKYVCVWMTVAIGSGAGRQARECVLVRVSNDDEWRGPGGESGFKQKIKTVSEFRCLFFFVLFYFRIRFLGEIRTKPTDIVNKTPQARRTTCESPNIFIRIKKKLKILDSPQRPMWTWVIFNFAGIERIQK